MMVTLWQKEHVDYKIRLLVQQKQARDLRLKTQGLRIEREKIYKKNFKSRFKTAFKIPSFLYGRGIRVADTKHNSICAADYSFANRSLLRKVINTKRAAP